MCKTVNPLTQEQVDAVFIPKMKTGYWSGSLSNQQIIQDTAVVDDDANCLRSGQLKLNCIESASDELDSDEKMGPHHLSCTDYDATSTNHT